MQSGDFRAAESEKNNTYILVEGPAWGDAEFYGNWLLMAAKANELLQQAKSDDPDFRNSIDTLEVWQLLDFGLMATCFIAQFVDKNFQTFVIAPDSVDLTEFILMAEMGFFTLTGDRYQMTLPTKLDMNRIKRAHLKLAETEDEDWIHPERLVVDTASATHF
jgi:hypothetical protein